MAQKVRIVKKTAAKRKTAGRKPRKLECKDCGLVLSVDELCGCKDLSNVTCCGVPMRSH
jgi:hypothetical protein